MLEELNPTKAFIFRITHRDNLPWLLANGLHCRRSDIVDPNFVAIGNPDLIDKRHVQIVAKPPGGRLSDYIPFYFTPLSMMALNIKTGRNVRQRSNSEIVILVSSLKKLAQNDVPFLFTDIHASVAGARFSSDLEDLNRIDWNILQNRDFSRNNDDMGKTSRYQAEALVHKHLPISSLLGVVCYNKETKEWAKSLAEKEEAHVDVITRTAWYF